MPRKCSERSAAGSAAGPPAARWRCEPLKSASMDKTSLRELFPVTKNLAYFNHAAVGPLSARAYEAMENFARDQREFGALHWKEWYAEYVRLRESAAKL